MSIVMVLDSPKINQFFSIEIEIHSLMNILAVVRLKRNEYIYGAIMNWTRTLSCKADREYSHRPYRKSRIRYIRDICRSVSRRLALTGA